MGFTGGRRGHCLVGVASSGWVFAPDDYFPHREVSVVAATLAIRSAVRPPTHIYEIRALWGVP